MTRSLVCVVGGESRETGEPLERREWFEEALVLRVDFETGQVEAVIRHVARPDQGPDETPSIVFEDDTRIGESGAPGT